MTLSTQDDVLLDLNDAQVAAVTHGEGQALILAGAGTGKTRVLTQRIAWLIDSRKARPAEILGLTFTEKAAQEMEDRVDRLVPFGFTDATLCTFHAFGHRLLSEFGLLLGLPGEPRVLTPAEAVVFLREHLYELPIDRLRPAGDPTRHLRKLVSHFARLSDEDISPESYAAHAEELVALEGTAPTDEAALERALLMRELAACYRAWLDLLAGAGLVDFAGLLSQALRLVREHPAVRSELMRRYRWILVDEFQDTNFAQFELVRAIAGTNPNLTVVGDDDQSIYKFRGAAISNILGFKAAYPRARTFVLTENYRSTRPILDSAYRLVRHNDPERLEVRAAVDKRLRASGPHPEGTAVEYRSFDTASNEADFVAARIAEAIEEGRWSFRDCAVLVRRSAAADPVARALNLRGIPFRDSGASGLFDRPEVVACLDGLRVLADPTDSRAFYMLAASGIYEVPLLDLMRLAGGADRRHRALEETVRAMLASRVEDASSSSSAPCSAPAREVFRKLIADLDELRPFAHRHSSGETLYRFLGVSGYLERLTAEGGAEADLKVQNLARLFDKIRGYAKVAVRDHVREFVRHLDLLREAGEDPPGAEPDPDEDAVQVLTVHKAKGLEFPVVFLVGLEAGHFPTLRRGDPLPFPDALIRQEVPSGDFHMMEERRLFYVGMTRAMRELWLSSSADHGGKRRWKTSPFVLEALDRQAADAAGVLKGSALEAVRRNAPRVDATPLELAPIPEDETLLLSHSQIDDWLTCPLKYKYAHVLKVPLLPHHSVGYGLALHNAIRDYYVHRQNGWPVDEVTLTALFERSWTGEGFITREHEEQRLEQGREAIRAFFAREQAAPSTPAFVERPFRMRLGTNEVRGRFDRVDARDGVGVVIVDFKSSAVQEKGEADRRAKESLQLQIYALAFEAVEERRPAAVELSYIASGVVGRAPVTDESLERASTQVARAAAGIRRRDFAAKPDYRACGFCAYNSFCPSRARGAFA
ncbi:MAG: ATP-dependent helicase [Candidatus Eiseniibacteriota bacterium]